MNESRSHNKVDATSTRQGKAHEMERNSKCKPSNVGQQRPLVKKSSWTSLATKGRRLNMKRKSLTGSSKAKKENDSHTATKEAQNYGKSIEEYTSWCNHYLLRGLHREISPDLRTALGDGVTLISLVESLSHKIVSGISRQPATWSQKLDNIHLCFKLLKSEGVMLHGISPEDIIEGQLNAVVSLLSRLESHYECLSYPSEKHVETKKHDSIVPNSPPDHVRNGRISSGYHSEDDGYTDRGRTTPILDLLPGFLTGSESEEEGSMLEPSDIRLDADGNLESQFRHSLPNHFTPISRNSRHIAAKFPASFNDHNTRDGRLDHIGYMPSHPSTKTRVSPTKTQYDERSSSFDKPASSHKSSHNNNDHLSHTSRHHANEHIGRTNHGLELTAADLGIDGNASFDQRSLSSTGTPVLPELSSPSSASSASSFEDLPLDFSSDVSGLTRENFATSTKIGPDLSESGSYNSVDIQKQLDSLHSMYQKLLVVVDKENQRKSKRNLPKMAALQLKTRNSTKQRVKDMKSVTRRFARVESHIVTLARTMDHLRSELHSQADTSRQVSELRADVSEVKESVYCGSLYTKHVHRSRDHQDRLHRLNKLKKFFGEEPPMIALLLQRLGYERYIPHFKAEEIGVLEIPYMTEQRLQNLGIPLGPRLRILEEVRKL